jgi:hypothetical protein
MIETHQRVDAVCQDNITHIVEYISQSEGGVCLGYFKTDVSVSTGTKPKQYRENEQFERPDSVREIFSELESIQVEDEVKNVLVAIVNLLLVVYSWNSKATVRHL